MKIDISVKEAENVVRDCSYDYFTLPFGTVTLVSEGERLSRIDLSNSFHLIGQRNETPVICDTKRWLDIYFSGTEPGFIPPLLLSGTPFRLKIWKMLTCIPYGTVISYGQLASGAAMGRGGMSARAVGGAVGHNPIPIIIPCHRVVGSDGSLVGYTGGLYIKRILLETEGLEIDALKR